MLRVIKMCYVKGEKDTYIMKINKEPFAYIKKIKESWLLYYYKEKIFLFFSELEEIVNRLEKELHFAIPKRFN